MIKNETKKEVGKYFLDISKILLAVGIVTPLINDKEISLITVSISVIGFALGVILLDFFHNPLKKEYRP